PAADAPGHRGHVLVAQVVEGLAGEQRAEPREAVDDDRRLGIGIGVLDLELEEAAADGHGAVDEALAILVRVADVDEDHRLAGREAVADVLDRNLGDGGLGVADEIAIGLHRVRSSGNGTSALRPRLPRISIGSIAYPGRRHRAARAAGPGAILGRPRSA